MTTSNSNHTVTIHTDGAQSTRELGARLATLLRAGDLVMVSGGLGAGKTTLAQGVGAGMGVRGRVSSPTFIIARAHPCQGEGPDLIHVDAYRLGSMEEVDSLDLDSSLAESVTLVEWGENKVESLSPDRLEVSVERPHGGLGEVGQDSLPPTRGGAPATGAVTDLAQADDGRRTITVRARGPRWAGVDLTVLAGQ